MEKEKFHYNLTLQSFSRKVIHPDLVQIHRRYIINFHKIVALNMAEMELLLARNGREIPLLIGKNYKAGLLERIQHLKTD